MVNNNILFMIELLYNIIIITGNYYYYYRLNILDYNIYGIIKIGNYNFYISICKTTPRNTIFSRENIQSGWFDFFIFFFT